MVNTQFEWEYMTENRLSISDMLCAVVKGQLRSKHVLCTISNYQAFLEINKLKQIL